MRPFNSLLLLLACCVPEKESDTIKLRQSIEQQLRSRTQQLTQAESVDDLPSFLQYYDEDIISMPEYQLTLDGREAVESFYREIFNRQNVKTFQRNPSEFIHLDSTVVEIGTFTKTYSEVQSDSLTTVSGKYWHIWETQPDGDFKLKGEAFGYFHHVANPETLIVNNDRRQPDDADIIKLKDIPFELKAYNALMEKGVRTRDGVLRSGFFTEDASFFPFADTAVTGIDQIKPYLIAYSSRGTISIDSIMCYTYAYENLGRYILEYDMFKVTWSRPDLSGRTEGKGIRIWKRQEDQSLRLYREIGTHNHIQ